MPNFTGAYKHLLMEELERLPGDLRGASHGLTISPSLPGRQLLHEHAQITRLRALPSEPSPSGHNHRSQRHEASPGEGRERSPPRVIILWGRAQGGITEILEKALSGLLVGPYFQPHPTIDIIFTHLFFTFDPKSFLSGPACPPWLLQLFQKVPQPLTPMA